MTKTGYRLQATGYGEMQSLPRSEPHGSFVPVDLHALEMWWLGRAVFSDSRLPVACSLKPVALIFTVARP